MCSSQARDVPTTSKTRVSFSLSSPSSSNEGEKIARRPMMGNLSDGHPGSGTTTSFDDIVPNNDSSNGNPLVLLLLPTPPTSDVSSSLLDFESGRDILKENEHV